MEAESKIEKVQFSCRFRPLHVPFSCHLGWRVVGLGVEVVGLAVGLGAETVGLGADALDCHEMADPDVAMKYHRKKRFRKGRSSRRRGYRGSLDRNGNRRTVHCCYLHARTSAGTAQSGRLVKSWSTTTGFRPLHVPFSWHIACPSTTQKVCGSVSSAAVDHGLSVLAELLMWRYSLQRFRPFESPSQLELPCWQSQIWTSRQHLAS